MKPKSTIAYIFAGLILMSLVFNSYSGFAHFVTDNITFVKPYCKNKISTAADSKAEVIDHQHEQQAQISLMCTSFVDFINPEFTLVYSEDNYENITFKEFLKLNLFDERNYLPPRLS
ncbi:hypothetical protein [Aequorivita xiaoshiensis]|uniref:Uncharacterized protein n=1 Tax=Aequorivita xiaoshiensis TaxID=2874476 RepID=A0A9X1QZI4_9FLAO|nr:hypothetical protein [Aequorivita xiaoshiensis]MCG2431541.1 hypothetical protein [Aequorivita xiaoshiensis]